MCELDGPKMQAAQLPPEMRAMKQMADGIDAIFAPHIARAKAQADKIHHAYLAMREADAEEADDSEAQP